MTPVDLRDEAAAEVKRLLASRALVREGDRAGGTQVETEGPWIVRVRSAALRAALRGRSVQLWRVALDDMNGRRAESSLVALAIDGGLSVDDAHVAAHVERQASRWRDEATQALAMFAAARLARARAIEAAQVTPAAALQPGLFDRRAEHLDAERTAARASSDADLQSRRVAVERAATVTSLPPRLLFSLVPRR
jgi:hypothetical protein